MYKIGINGFGRTGRLVLRAALDKGAEVVAVNDPFVTINKMVNSFKFDAIRGRFHGSVEADNDRLIVNGQVISVLRIREPKDIPWSSVGAEYIIEATGIFNTEQKAEAHIDAGAKKVVISSPCSKPPMFVRVDFEAFNHNEKARE